MSLFIHCASVSNSCFPSDQWFQKQQKIKTERNSPKLVNQITKRNLNPNYHQKALTSIIKSKSILWFRSGITHEQLKFLAQLPVSASTFPPLLPNQAFNRLEETQLHWGGQSAIDPNVNLLQKHPEISSQIYPK